MKELVAALALGLGTLALSAGAASDGVPALIAADQKPGGATMREAYFIADISQPDAKTGAISVTSAEGRTFDRTVKDTAAPKGFQAGDQLEGTYLRLMAIGGVAPPAKP